MAFVTDSRFAGYLGPQEPPGPMTGNTWQDFIHDVIAGVTGLDGSMVRPRWQTVPPNRPDITDNWCGFGIVSTTADYCPVFIHVDRGDHGRFPDGFDALQQMEENTIECAFYGPDCEKYVSYLQRGLWVPQNQAAFRLNAVGLVSVSGTTHAADLVKQQWWPRSDISFIVRREVRYDYAVLNLLRAQVDLKANPPGESRLIERFVDTGSTDVYPIMLRTGQGVLGAGQGKVLGVGQTI
jgi:hypothetical protein